MDNNTQEPTVPEITLDALSWLDPKQLEKFYGFSIQRQTKLRKEKILPYSKIGNYIRYQKTAIESFLLSHNMAPPLPIFKCFLW